MIKKALLALAIAGAMTTAQASVVLNEGFENVPTLANSGWLLVNASALGMAGQPPLDDVTVGRLGAALVRVHPGPAQRARALHFPSAAESRGWPPTVKLRRVPTSRARAEQSMAGRLLPWGATQPPAPHLHATSLTISRAAAGGSIRTVRRPGSGATRLAGASGSG